MVITVEGSSSVQAAAALMRNHNIGDVIVVKNELTGPKPVGILTDRDIVVSTVAVGVPPETVTVADIMTPAVEVVNAEDDLDHVVKVMKQRGIRRLPIVDSKGTIVGILSYDDLLEHFAEEFGDLIAVNRKQRKVEGSRRRALA